MYTAKIQNQSGETLTLTGNEPEYQVISITGLNPPRAQINVTNIAGMDGAKFNSSKLNTRNIVITLAIKGDVESNRQMLYRFFRTKEDCTFYFSNENRDVYIEGYIESVEVDLFQLGEKMQISIVCPQPYFINAQEIVAELSKVIAGFSFPFSIDLGSPIPFSTYDDGKVVNVINNSESTTGMIIDIYIRQPCSEIEIKNTTNGDSLVLQYAFEAGDQIFIDTMQGEKSVQLIRDGVAQNIFSALTKGSTFLQLQVGDNIFNYIVDDGEGNNYVAIQFVYSSKYRGV